VTNEKQMTIIALFTDSLNVNESVYRHCEYVASCEQRTQPSEHAGQVISS